MVVRVLLVASPFVDIVVVLFALVLRLDIPVVTLALCVVGCAANHIDIKGCVALLDFVEAGLECHCAPARNLGLLHHLRHMYKHIVAPALVWLDKAVPFFREPLHNLSSFGQRNSCLAVFFAPGTIT